MDRRILIQITAPAVVIGFLLFAACVVSAWMVNHLQTNLSNVLSDNVASLDAAQDLETSVRQLHVDCYRYLRDSERSLVDGEVAAAIDSDNAAFQAALARAEDSVHTPAERECIEKIIDGHQSYQQAFDRLRAAAAKQRAHYRLADETLLHLMIDPCEEFMKLNREMMNDTRAESERVSRILSMVMLLLGLVGPISGLIIGWGMARGLSRSIHRLSVRVQDMAQQLEQDVASVSLSSEGDVRNLDRQLDKVVGRVREVAQQVQQHHREMIRAQQLSAVGQLAASVAHEVRNPLMSIKMLVEAALRAEKPRPFTRENLTIIHHEIVRLEKSVQDFLDFSRPPALQRKVCDLREVVASAVALVQTRARQQKVEIASDRTSDAVLGLVDQDQFCSVLVNLFINALDAMPRGGRLEVRLGMSGGVINVAVQDTGEGIAPAVLEQLFTPFISSKPTGTGLGLCISRRIIEDHGGQLHGGNAPEGGACFTLTLPVATS